MGSCVSTHYSSDLEPAMKLEMSFGSKTDKKFIQSPVKVEPPINAANFTTTLRDSGMTTLFSFSNCIIGIWICVSCYPA